MVKKQNVHTNHRKRLKSKFINSGLDHFAEHEILELLLFFSIPQQDTNPLAHKLIKKYGCLKNVLDASFDSLISSDGVGEHSAVLLKLIPAVMQIYNMQATRTIKRIENQIVAMEYVSQLFKGINYEEFFVICLSAGGEVLGHTKLSTGDSTKVEVKLRSVTNYVLKNNGARIIIAHNHPHNNSSPSDSDILMTHKLFSSCVLNEIDIIDHIIYSASGCYSFAAQGILDAIKVDVLKLLKYDPEDPLYKKFSSSTLEYVIK